MADTTPTQPTEEGLFKQYWKKFLAVITDENKFFKDNPHLKAFRTKLVATIIVIFYVGVLALVSKGLSALLSLLNVPYNNFIAIGISIVAFIFITIKDVRSNPLNVKTKKRIPKMNKKAWFGLDPRLELIIIAIIIFIILVSVGIIQLK